MPTKNWKSDGVSTSMRQRISLHLAMHGADNSYSCLHHATGQTDIQLRSLALYDGPEIDPFLYIIRLYIVKTLAEEACGVVAYTGVYSSSTRKIMHNMVDPFAYQLLP
jgi:hypothetical protein